jgi:hypothetical protein
MKLWSTPSKEDLDAAAAALLLIPGCVLKAFDGEVGGSLCI